MTLHLPSMLLGGLLISSFAVNLHASAQTTAPTPDALDVAPMQTEVTIGEWIFDMPTNQPLAVFPVATSADLEHRYVTYTVAVRHPDGTVAGLTECDGRAIICQPMTSQAIAALASADPNDVFVLAGEAKS